MRRALLVSWILLAMGLQAPSHAQGLLGGSRLPPGSVAPLPDEPMSLYRTNCCPPPLRPGGIVPGNRTCNHCVVFTEEYRQALRAVAYGKRTAVRAGYVVTTDENQAKHGTTLRTAATPGCRSWAIGTGRAT